VRTIVVSAIGDNTLGGPIGSERAPGSFQFVHESNGADPARPFSGVRSVLEKDDLTIGNLEGPLTTAGCGGGKAFVFRGDPAYAEMLVRGSVEVVSLANNHAEDCGVRGDEDTRSALARQGVGHFGLGVVDERIVKGVQVVNLGYTGGELAVKAEVVRDVAKHKRPDNLVFVSFHWGVEGSLAFASTQQKLGRAAIDAGADLVLGHHPHVLQGIENYRGKRIVYSLGNFVFGGNGQPRDLDSMIFRAKFAFEGAALVDVGYEIVPVRFSGSSVQNDFRPVLATGDEAEAIRKKVVGASPRGEAEAIF
jgi:poly-gamma-glutamate synthesis protein (capsule biosynthesis protein)